MTAANILSTAILVGLLVATLASKSDAQSARRTAAIERCMARAQAQWPYTGTEGNGRNRTASYKACMFAAGQRP